jgi:hypothetical protein
MLIGSCGPECFTVLDLAPGKPPISHFIFHLGISTQFLPSRHVAHSARDMLLLTFFVGSHRSYCSETLTQEKNAYGKKQKFAHAGRKQKSPVPYTLAL